jgi:hypothetical protein
MTKCLNIYLLISLAQTHLVQSLYKILVVYSSSYEVYSGHVVYMMLPWLNLCTDIARVRENES